MTLHVLSLNDQALTVGNEHGILARSPGCVVDCDGQVLFGEEAAARSRLYPVTFSNRFWHELDMEPLTRTIAHFRHHADIAHAHLAHLARLAGMDPSAAVETLVLVPGTFGRDQLATLLGIMRHSPFRPVALVDTGAVAGAVALEEEQGLHLDMQLHEMVVTGLQNDGTDVRQDRATAVPGLGWHQLESSLVALSAEAFIRQARFNPGHDAHWEQRLHDRLPEWLRQSPGEDDNLLIVLEGEGQRHQARLTRSAVEQRLRSLYRNLAQSLPPGTQEAALVLAERCSTLPGLRDLVSSGPHDPQTVQDEQLIATALSASGELRQEAGSRLRFNRSVPVHRASRRVTRTRQAREPATHALAGHQARALRDGIYCCADTDGMLRLYNGKPAVDGLTVVGEIRAHDGLFFLHCHTDGLLHNGRPCPEPQALYSGDRLQRAEAPTRSLQLIQVHDG